MTFCLISASLGRKIGGHSQFLGKFAAGLTLKCAIKNGVNVVRFGCTSQGRRAENHSAGKFGEELQSSLLRIAHDSKQAIVAVEFAWLRMIRQASDS